MTTFYREVEFDISLSDFDEDEIIEYLEWKGYSVTKSPEELFDIIPIEEYWNQGNRKEALILLERKFPELIGISRLLD